MSNSPMRKIRFKGVEYWLRNILTPVSHEQLWEINDWNDEGEYIGSSMHCYAITVDDRIMRYSKQIGTTDEIEYL